VGDLWIRPYQRDEDRPEFGICPRKLDGQGGEDETEVAPVFKVSGAEEGGTESSLCERPLRDCLSNGALPRSSETVQPVNRGFVKVACPELDLVQDGTAGPLETSVAVAMAVLCLSSATKIVEGSRFGCRRKRVRNPSLR
jgi:hypothetical protein